jgi:hypothetical protein
MEAANRYLEHTYRDVLADRHFPTAAGRRAGWSALRQAEAPLRAMMEWSVLFHDIGKQVVAGTRDAVHAVRSAALTARALPRLGFGCMNDHALVVEPWVDLVLGASVPALDGKGLVQDYRPLPQILEGSERLFGERSAAALIVQAVLLHQSLNVVPEWPNAASLTDVQVGACISPALVPLLEGLMLVDSDAWQLFQPERKAQFRQSTLATFATVRQLVSTAAST